MYQVKTKSTDVSYDEGLRSYMLSIYNWLFLGLAVSTVSAYVTVASGLITTLAAGGLMFWAVLLSPFVLILYMGMANADKSSLPNMAIAYIVFTVLQGMSLSLVISQYTAASVVMALATTTATFAGMSLWGYTTKRNLSGLGSFFLMALIGLIVATLIGVFLKSSAFDILISLAGVAIFAGLVAYDTQTMRDDYVPGAADHNAHYAIWHALSLFLDFINLLLMFLRLFGVSSDDD